MEIKIFTTAAELKAQISKDKSQGLTLGFVPTMGALHKGHISLIRKALSENDRVLCSIFVNPTQFNDAKDLEKYPRMAEQDIELLKEAGCHYLFLPTVQEMYPEGEASIDFGLGGITTSMEGKFRPGHFNGVATIVDRLFQHANADNAYFGEKDFQQLAVIRKMAELRNHKTKIVGCPTLREEDGLAMSSRNMLLKPEERKAASKIYAGLEKARAFIPHQTVAAVKDLVVRYIEQSPLLKVQYLEFVDPQTLEPVTNWQQHQHIQACIAVLTSGPRLIDNVQYVVEEVASN